MNKNVKCDRNYSSFAYRCSWLVTYKKETKELKLIENIFFTIKPLILIYSLKIEKKNNVREKM